MLQKLWEIKIISPVLTQKRGGRKTGEGGRRRRRRRRRIIGITSEGKLAQHLTAVKKKRDRSPLCRKRNKDDKGRTKRRSAATPDRIAKCESHGRGRREKRNISPARKIADESESESSLCARSNVRKSTRAWIAHADTSGSEHRDRRACFQTRETSVRSAILNSRSLLLAQAIHGFESLAV